jgi:hypothetical protein
MTDADVLDDIVARLVMVRDRLGSDAFHEAALKAAVAVAQVALAEAERRAGKRCRRRKGNVVPFPAGRNHRRPDKE